MAFRNTHTHVHYSSLDLALHLGQSSSLAAAVRGEGPYQDSEDQSLDPLDVGTVDLVAQLQAVFVLEVGRAVLMEEELQTVD